jgi:pilus assembly protein CpaE
VSKEIVIGNKLNIHFEREVHWFNSIKQLKENLNLNEKGILFLLAKELDVYNICQEFSLANPSIAIIVIDSESEIDMRKAIRSGAFDVIEYPSNKDQIHHLVQEVEEQFSSKKIKPNITSSVSAPEKSARVMTVCSTKGGVGKTTFTVNLAGALTKQLKKVLVIDLDLQFGDVSMFFNCKPKKTMYEWIKEDSSGTTDKLKSYLCTYSDYIDIMPAPQRPEFSEVISESHIKTLIAQTKPLYDVIIIDTAPYMEEKILTALEKSDDIFLLTYLDLPTLKNSKTILDTLNSLSFLPKVKVVLNRYSTSKGINLETVANILGVPITLTLPDLEKVVIPSVNEGTPYVYTSPRSKIAKTIFNFAQDLFPSPKAQQPKQKKSFFFKKALQEGRSV